MSIFIIAEIGINHNGDIDLAKKLIDVAIIAGCDAVKFQKRTVNAVYTEEQLDIYRESPWGTTAREQKQQLEFGKDQYDEIDVYCKDKGIIWFASAWDYESQIFLNSYDLQYNKIASAMIIDEDFLREVAAKGKHTFISTGMCDLAIIEKAVNIFREAECPFEIMHCISTYPMNDTDANLNCINTLRNVFRCNVGYSGHEVGLAISYAAAALGITSLERHITLNRSSYGSDQAASVEPMGLIQLVGAVRKIEHAMGDGKIEITDKEIAVAEKLRMHIKK